MLCLKHRRLSQPLCIFFIIIPLWKLRHFLPWLIPLSHENLIPQAHFISFYILRFFGGPQNIVIRTFAPWGVILLLRLQGNDCCWLISPLHPITRWRVGSAGKQSFGCAQIPPAFWSRGLCESTRASKTLAEPIRQPEWHFSAQQRFLWEWKAGGVFIFACLEVAESNLSAPFLPSVDAALVSVLPGMLARARSLGNRSCWVP